MWQNPFVLPVIYVFNKWQVIFMMVGIKEMISESRLLAEQQEFMIVYYNRIDERVDYTIYPIVQSCNQYRIIQQNTSLNVIYLFTLFSPYLGTENNLLKTVQQYNKEFLTVDRYKKLKLEWYDN